MTREGCFYEPRLCKYVALQSVRCYYATPARYRSFLTLRDTAVFIIHRAIPVWRLSSQALCLFLGTEGGMLQFFILNHFQDFICCGLWMIDIPSVHIGKFRRRTGIICIDHYITMGINNGLAVCQCNTNDTIPYKSS